MKLSGLKSYLSKPSRAVIASLILTAMAVLLMFVFKPVFPEKTAIYAPQSPVGSLDVGPGESITVRFKSFTVFDSLSVSLFPDSPSMTYDAKVNKLDDEDYVLTMTNTGDDVLKVMLEAPKIYGAIEQQEGGGTVDIAVYKKGSPGSNIFAFVTLFTALFVFFTSFAYLTDNLTPSKFYLIGAVTLGLGVYPILFPAWCSHDADAHFQAAYRFSNFLLGKGGGWTARQCDVDFFRGSWKNFVFEGGYRPDPSNEMYLPTVLNNKMFVSADKTSMVTSDGGDYAYMVFYSIFNYLPLSAGMALGRLINLSPMYMIHLARYIQGALFVFLTWRAIKRVRSENVQYLLTFVSLFPMSLAYLTAFSYDGAVLTYVICGIAMLFCFAEDEEFWKKGNIIESLIWFFLIGSVKGGAYVIMIPMVFMLLRKPLKDKKNLLPVLLTVAAFTGLVFSDVILKPRGEELFQLKGGADFYETSFAYKHPFSYLVMCVSTLFAFSGEIITDSAGRSEGWNEAVIPGIIIVLMIAGMYLAVFASKKVMKVTKTQAVSLILACVLLLLCAPAMLLKDTPLDYSLIMGVQGRYFRPMVPLVVMLFAGLAELIAKKLEKKSIEQISSKAGIIKGTGLILFAATSVASVIAMLSLYLGR